MLSNRQVPAKAPFPDGLNSRGASSFFTILAIFFVAVVLRGVCAVWFSGMIDGQGAEYARMAQNLLSGVGLRGITDGREFIFPPMFPFFISAVTLLTGDAEIAGRIISVVLGSAIVVPVYLIAKHMYGRRIAVGAAALAAVHPFLIKYSSQVFGEPTYLTIVLTAIYMAMRSMENPTTYSLLMSGVLYGIAYLIRPEASAFMVVATGLLFLQFYFQRAPGQLLLVSRPLLVVAGFLLLATPYVAWLSVKTGHIMLEGKASYNVPTEQRIQQGLSTYAAAFEITPDLKARGIWIKPADEVIKEYKNHPLGAVELAGLLIKRARKLSHDASATIAGSLAFGSPALFALAVLGLFSFPWNGRFAVTQLHVGAVLAATLFALCFTYSLQERFYVIFVPFLVIWATWGAVVFSQWAQRSAAIWGLSEAHKDYFAKAIQALAILAIVLPSAIVNLGDLRAIRSEQPFRKMLMDFANNHTAPIRIASTTTPPAFHTHAQFVWLPYSDGETARRYLAEKAVTHVALWGSPVETPYQTKWIEEGVPRAKRIADLTSSATGQRFVLYELEK